MRKYINILEKLIDNLTFSMNENPYGGSVDQYIARLNQITIAIWRLEKIERLRNTLPNTKTTDRFEDMDLDEGSGEDT